MANNGRVSYQGTEAAGNVAPDGRLAYQGLEAYGAASAADGRLVYQGLEAMAAATAADGRLVYQGLEVFLASELPLAGGAVFQGDIFVDPTRWQGGSVQGGPSSPQGGGEP